ncbi:MAG: hypothetical protein SGARI_004552, partial [Bacillariaceae sp.]
MGTFSHNADPACSRNNWNSKADNATGPTFDKATFAPSSLNVTQWFDSITALGAKNAVLTAKHGCGFLLWPTQATFPNNTGKRGYGYHTDYDLVRDFQQVATAANVGYGYYYSIQKNFYLCRGFAGDNTCLDEVLEHQVNVTDAEYHDIVTQHVTELWTHYGDFAEIWVDSALQGFGDLMVKLQPNAAGTPAHPRFWCGTESGHPSRDVGGGSVWQTGFGHHGDRASTQWVDKFCDPQLFRDHVWFWEKDRAVRSLEEMIPIYHDIVGRGMIMELDFAINREGLVDPTHEQVYRALGNWVKECYGNPIASIRNVSGGYTYQLAVPRGSYFDRVMIEEDVSRGQRIRNYTLSISVKDESVAHAIVLLSNGTSVGRKRIHIFDQGRLWASAADTILTLEISEAIAPPQIKLFGVYAPCYPQSMEQAQE